MSHRIKWNNEKWHNEIVSLYSPIRLKRENKVRMKIFENLSTVSLNPKFTSSYKKKGKYLLYFSDQTYLYSRHPFFYSQVFCWRLWLIEGLLLKRYIKSIKSFVKLAELCRGDAAPLEQTSHWWRAFRNSVSNLTSLRFEPQTTYSRRAHYRSTNWPLLKR